MERTNNGPRKPADSSHLLRLYSLLGAMLLFWSANYIFAKIALREIPSALVVCLRTVLSGIFMWPIYLLAHQRWEPGVRRWSPRDAPKLMAVGVLGLVGNQMLFIIALGRTSVAHGSVISATAPIFVLLGAAMLGQEQLTFRKLGGMLTAAAGIALLQFAQSERGRATLIGDLLMLVSAIVFAAFNIYGKPLAVEFGTVTLNTFAFTGAGLLVLPLTIWSLAHYQFSEAGVAAWAGVLYMSIFPSILGYLIYSYALRYLPASRVASVSYLQPMSATLLAILFLHEKAGAAFVAGAALVLGGVWATGRSEARPRPICPKLTAFQPIRRKSG